ncbi:MAG: cytochrome b/b6 domain-containing protein, partial [Candidatus Thiodiazotropha lotti]
MKRYHSLLITLHWLLAVLILMGLIMGSNVLSPTPNDVPEKLLYLRVHMSMGMLILVLMMVRLVVRVFSKKPAAADIGHSFLNKLGVTTHYLLYLITLLLAVSGLATASLAGLPDIVFGGSSAPVPASFDEFPPRIAHGILASVLLFLVVGHVMASLYHQFVRRDGLFSRM